MRLFFFCVQQGERDRSDAEDRHLNEPFQLVDRENASPAQESNEEILLQTQDVAFLFTFVST